MNERILVIYRCFDCPYFYSAEERCLKSCCGLYPETGFEIPDWCELESTYKPN